MIWPFENDTSFVIKKLADRSFRANKMRNVIAIIAIALTAILFTSLFTLGIDVKESTRQANMILSGGDGHARLIHMDEAEYETISGYPLIKEIGEEITLTLTVHNQQITRSFVLAGWWESYPGVNYGTIAASAYFYRRSNVCVDHGAGQHSETGKDSVEGVSY